MTVSLDDLAGPADAFRTPDFKRDQWDRPSIMQPNGKRKGYTRCSSAAKTIEDTFNLDRHDRRLIAYGMAYDSSLVARLIAVGGDPSSWQKAEKDQINTICDDARTAAKAHKAADIGTAIHHLTHRLDRGEDVIGGPYQADLDAYRQAMNVAGLQVDARFIECRMVNDLLEMAGSTDRIIYKVIQHNGRTTSAAYHIADIKTGASIEFGGLGWAAQLAAYAGGLIYDVEKDERVETPPIDQRVGYIIHLPAGRGRCDIYEVDLIAGHRAAELANEIRKIRKDAKTWIVPTTNSGDSEASSSTALLPTSAPHGTETTMSSTPITSPSGQREPSPGPQTQPDWRFEAKRRYNLLSTDEQVAYTERKKAIDTSDPAAVFALLDEIDAFNVTVPPHQHRIHINRPEIQICDCGARRSKVGESWVLHDIYKVDRPPDEGGTVDRADVDALHKRFAALGTEAQLWTGKLVAQGKATHPFRIKDRASVRRYELYRGILAIAEWVKW